MSTLNNTRTALQPGAPISLCDVRGPIGTLLDALNGESGRQWLRALNKFLRKEDAWLWSANDFPLWTHLRGNEKLEDILGEYREHIDYQYPAEKQGLEEMGDREMKYFEELVRAARFTNEELELTLLSFRDLGYKPKEIRYGERFPSWIEICKKVTDLGFGLCPADTGPRLCRWGGGANRAMVENLFGAVVVMKPIKLGKQCVVYSINDRQNALDHFRKLGTYQIDGQRGHLLRAGTYLPTLIVRRLNLPQPNKKVRVDIPSGAEAEEATSS